MSKRRAGKKRIADVLKIRLVRKYGGFKAAVRSLGLFSYDALRQDLSKNRFFENDLLKICAETGLPSDLASLRKEYDFAVKKSERGMRRLAHETSSVPPTLNDAFDIIDTRMARLEHVATSAKEVVPQFFDAMDGTDLLAVFMSDEFPSHWTGPDGAGWAPMIHKALERGAAVVYFHPSDEIAQQVRDNGCTAKMLTGADVQPAFDAFCARLLGVGANEQELHNLVLVPCKNPAAFTPQHRYGLYFHRGKDSRLVRATEAIPIKHSTDTDATHSRYWILTPSYQFTSFLQQICEQTLNDEIKHLTASSGAGVKIEQLRKILERCYFIKKPPVETKQNRRQ